MSFGVGNFGIFLSITVFCEIQATKHCVCKPVGEATLHQDVHLEIAHGGNDAGEEWNADL